MNVAAWLRCLGLERYTQAFADHDIDADTLYRLNGVDLAEIGVKSVGHRRMLLEAIAALDEATPLQGAVPATPAPAEAEHRQLTVLYCAMGGSGAQTSGIQSEEMREVIRSFHQACTRMVAEFDGYMANFFGDCVLAYFGWPRAHEDDAERAVRAGLALARCMVMVHRGSGPGEALVLRVGIATGAVVVGDLAGVGPAHEQSAVGLAPNLGARILSLAAPGQVAIDELTRRLLAPSFTVQALGRHALKGIAEPVAAYLVSGERPSESRFDARKGQELPPMVGRDQELALLMERWAQARGGEGQAVMLLGEAGIGKSRLARALLDACDAGPDGRILWQCSAYHTGSALWPVIQRLSRAAGLDVQDSTDAVLDKLETLAGQNAEATALYAKLLGLEGTQRYGPLEMTPQMLRSRTLELMAEQLVERAEQQPMLLVLEDAHWSDPTTLELIERCLERLDSARMLILITSRPDKQPKLGAHPGVTRLSLNRLSRASLESIVTRLGGNSLQAQTRATIVAQADGVPLFVEELTKAVLETGEAVIPASLHGSLMARLDHLPGVKEVAQIAACIGREFDLALLRAVAEQPTAVDAALDKLVAAELVFRRGDRADSRFIFKHALVQEAANESLLRGKRRSIHARILQVLEAERAQTPPEVLAHHAEGAHQAEKALACWRQAGDASLAKSAYVEATNCYVSAIRLVEAQPQGSDRKTQELELQLRLASTYVPAQGSGAESTRTAFQRAEELLDDDPRKHLLVHFGLWAWSAMAGRLGEALARTTRVLSAAKADGRDEAKLLAHTIVAISHLLRGELGPARDHFERALAFHDPTRPAQLVAEIGYDPGALAHCFFGWALCIQGFAEQGKGMLDRAQGIACVLPQVIARVNTRLICALSGACARDLAAARTNAEALAELATRHRLAKSSSYASNLLGWVAMESGRPAEAVARHEQAIARRTGMARVYDVFFSSWWATALAATGRHEKALHMIEQGIHESEEMAQGWCDAELWRVRGELLLGSPQHDEAQASRCFKRALAIARQRGAKLWELRAAVSLARLWARQGEVARAVDLLTPIYDWFTEGFDAIDLVEARALLNTLRQQLS